MIEWQIIVIFDISLENIMSGRCDLFIVLRNFSNFCQFHY